MLTALLALAGAARAAGFAELPAVVATPPLAAPAFAAPAFKATPSLSAVASPSLAAPPLCAPAALPSAAPRAAQAAAVPVAPSAGFALVERRGVDSFGRSVLILDALDPADASRGTIGHIDVSFHGDQASLDQPLDSWVEAAPQPSDWPADADLTHWREHLWFGLAVLPDARGAGLGSRLLDEADRRLRAAGVKLLFIRATEASVGFYRRHYGARVRHEETEIDRDGVRDHRLEVELGAP